MPLRLRDVQFLLSLLHFLGFLGAIVDAQPRNYLRLYVDGVATNLVGPMSNTPEAQSLLHSDSVPLLVLPSRPRRELAEVVDSQLAPDQFTELRRKKSAEKLARYSRNLPEQEKMYQIQNVGDLPMFRFG